MTSKTVLNMTLGELLEKIHTLAEREQGSAPALTATVVAAPAAEPELAPPPVKRNRITAIEVETFTALLYEQIAAAGEAGISCLELAQNSPIPTPNRVFCLNKLLTSGLIRKTGNRRSTRYYVV